MDGSIHGVGCDPPRMSRGKPVKWNSTVHNRDRDDFFEDYQSLLPANRICVDCKNNNAQWASASFGTIICIECSGQHRNLGVHLSFVRSLNMDSWTMKQFKIMELGGNLRFLEFLRSESIEDLPIKLKYNDERVCRYREALKDELETWCEENPVGLFWPRLAPENASAVSPSSASSSSPSQLRLQRSHSSDAHRRRSARRRKHDRENGSSSEEDGGDPRPKTPKPRKLHVPSPELDQGSASRLQSKLEEARQRREAKARRKRDQHSPTQSMHRPGKRSGGQGQERRSRKDRTEERQKIGRMMAEGGLSQGKGLSAQERRNPNLVRRANRAEGHQQESDLTWSEGILTAARIAKQGALAAGSVISKGGKALANQAKTRFRRPTPGQPPEDDGLELPEDGGIGLYGGSDTQSLAEVFSDRRSANAENSADDQDWDWLQDSVSGAPGDEFESPKASSSPSAAASPEAEGEAGHDSRRKKSSQRRRRQQNESKSAPQVREEEEEEDLDDIWGDLLSGDHQDSPKAPPVSSSGQHKGGDDAFADFFA